MWKLTFRRRGFRTRKVALFWGTPVEAEKYELGGCA